jgi:hypothetical protein
MSLTFQGAFREQLSKANKKISHRGHDLALREDVLVTSPDGFRTGDRVRCSTGQRLSVGPQEAGIALADAKGRRETRRLPETMKSW